MKEQTGKKNKKIKQYDFTQGGMLGPMIMFSLPVLLGSVFTALYNVVDSIVIGRYVGSGALAAVNASFAIMMVCVAIYAGFGMGTGVLTGQFFGAKQHDMLTKTCATAFVGAFLIGLTMSVVGVVISNPLLRLINTPDDIMGMAQIYLRIIMCGNMTQLFYYMTSGILRGLGDSKTPMYCGIFCAVLNMVLDLLFVVKFQMGAGGVALATVIAQAASAVLVVSKVITGGYGIEINRKTLRIDGQVLKMILHIGVPSAIQMLANSIGLLFIQSFSNSFGTSFIAANGVIQKVDTFALIPMQSMGQTITMYNAQNLGASKMDRVKKGNRQVLIFIAAIGVLIGALIYLFAGNIYTIFISKSDPNFQDVLTMGVTGLHIMAFFYIALSIQQGYAAIMQGASATMPVMIITIICIIVRIPLTYGMAMTTHNYRNLFWATSIFNTLYMVMLMLYYRFGKWKSYMQVGRMKRENN